MEPEFDFTIDDERPKTDYNVRGHQLSAADYRAYLAYMEAVERNPQLRTLVVPREDDIYKEVARRCGERVDDEDRTIREFARSHTRYNPPMLEDHKYDHLLGMTAAEFKRTPDYKLLMEFGSWDRRGEVIYAPGFDGRVYVPPPCRERYMKAQYAMSGLAYYDDGKVEYLNIPPSQLPLRCGTCERVSFTEMNLKVPTLGYHPRDDTFENMLSKLEEVDGIPFDDGENDFPIDYEASNLDIAYDKVEPVPNLAQHKGQVKLLVNEQLFLSKFAGDGARTLVVVAGAAPGLHYVPLIGMNPHCQFIFIDPRRLDIVVPGMKDYVEEIELGRHYVVHGPATPQLLQKIRLANPGLRVLMISDIRTTNMDDTVDRLGPTEVNVLEDQSFQLSLLTALNPERALVKVRFPFPVAGGPRKFYTPCYELQFQHYGPANSSELRGIWSKSQPGKVISLRKLDQLMMWYNRRRVCIVKGTKDCVDCHIVKSYTSFPPLLDYIRDPRSIGLSVMNWASVAKGFKLPASGFAVGANSYKAVDYKDVLESGEAVPSNSFVRVDDAVQLWQVYMAFTPEKPSAQNTLADVIMTLTSFLRSRPLVGARAFEISSKLHLKKAEVNKILYDLQKVGVVSVEFRVGPQGSKSDPRWFFTSQMRSLVASIGIPGSALGPVYDYFYRTGIMKSGPHGSAVWNFRAQKSTVKFPEQLFSI